MNRCPEERRSGLDPRDREGRRLVVDDTESRLGVFIFERAQEDRTERLQIDRRSDLTRQAKDRIRGRGVARTDDGLRFDHALESRGVPLEEDLAGRSRGDDRLGTRRHAGLGKLYPLDPERLRAHVADEKAMNHRPPLTQSAEVIRGLEELCSRRGRSETQEEQAREERPASLPAMGGTGMGACCPASDTIMMTP